MKRRVIAGVAAALFLVAAGGGVASADKNNGTGGVEGGSFLCPITGAGSVNSVNAIPGGTPNGPSLLPGHGWIQAGVHANANALNSHGDGSPGADGNSPGADGWSPIWAVGSPPQE